MSSSPTPVSLSTIDDVIAEIRQDEARQREQAMAAITGVFAAGPSPSVDIHPGRGSRLIGRGPGNVAKYSPSGELIGWYRDGQKSGKPSRRMPVEVDGDKTLEGYLKSLRAACSTRHHAQTLGRRSGVARAARGLTTAIVAAWDALARAQVPRHHRPKRIAQTLGCSVKHSRAVILAHRKNAR